MPNLYADVVGVATGNGIQIAKHRGFMKRFVLLASIVVAMCINAGMSFAQAVTFVRVCDTFGATYFFIPGTDKCAPGKDLPYVYNTQFGTYSTQPGVQSTAYGTDAFSNGTGSVAIGDHAFAGGDPFSGSPERAAASMAKLPTARTRTLTRRPSDRARAQAPRRLGKTTQPRWATARSPTPQTPRRLARARRPTPRIPSRSALAPWQTSPTPFRWVR